jgi:hypothetical protein
MKKQALVVAVNPPRIAHVEGSLFKVKVVYMTKPYTFQDEQGEIVHVAAKKRKRDVFVTTRPVIGQWIEVNFL